jgi:hypothetical protein
MVTCILFYSVVHYVLGKKQIWADLSRKKVAEKVSVAKIKMEYIYIIYKKKIIYTLIK